MLPSLLIVGALDLAHRHRSHSCSCTFRSRCSRHRSACGCSMCNINSRTTTGRMSSELGLARGRLARQLALRSARVAALVHGQYRRASRASSLQPYPLLPACRRCCASIRSFARIGRLSLLESFAACASCCGTRTDAAWCHSTTAHRHGEAGFRGGGGGALCSCPLWVRSCEAGQPGMSASCQNQTSVASAMPIRALALITQEDLAFVVEYSIRRRPGRSRNDGDRPDARQSSGQ